MQIGSSSSTVTLVYASGATFQADWIEFTWMTAVEASSWGAIKQLFR